jgi:O-acetylserine/cysteine efflux transporter
VTLRDSLLTLLVVFIWGASFSVIKIGVETIPPLLLSALRFLLVAFPAVLFIEKPKGDRGLIVAIGLLLGVLKFGFLFVAIDVGLPAGVSSILLQLQMVLTILICLFLYQEQVSKNQLLGIGIALIGFVLFLSTAVKGSSLTGITLVFMAAVSWAVSNVLMKKVTALKLTDLIVWMSLIPPLPLFVLSWVFETKQPLHVIQNITLSGWGVIIYLSFVSTLLAYAIWGGMLKKYTSVTVTPFALLIPFVGVMVSNIVLNETLTFNEVAAGGFIFIGLVMCVVRRV